MESSAMISMGPGLGYFLLFSLAIKALIIACFWQILSKAGYKGALSLIILIPALGELVMLIFIIMLAFGKWPIYENLSKGIMGNEE
jgi:uncharacterized membrane protein YhaH (DUF805 family)